MIHITKLSKMSENNLNTFNLNDWIKYVLTDNYKRLQIIIKEYNQKYTAHFN